MYSLFSPVICPLMNWHYGPIHLDMEHGDKNIKWRCYTSLQSLSGQHENFTICIYCFLYRALPTLLSRTMLTSAGQQEEMHKQAVCSTPPRAQSSAPANERSLQTGTNAYCISSVFILSERINLLDVWGCRRKPLFICAAHTENNNCKWKDEIAQDAHGGKTELDIFIQGTRIGRRRFRFNTCGVSSRSVNMDRMRNSSTMLVWMKRRDAHFFYPSMSQSGYSRSPRPYTCFLSPLRPIEIEGTY